MTDESNDTINDRVNGGEVIAKVLSVSGVRDLCMPTSRNTRTLATATVVTLIVVAGGMPLTVSVRGDRGTSQPYMVTITGYMW